MRSQKCWMSSKEAPYSEALQDGSLLRYVEPYSDEKPKDRASAYVRAHQLPHLVVLHGSLF